MDLTESGANVIPYHLLKLQRNPQTDKDTNTAVEKMGYIKKI